MSIELLPQLPLRKAVCTDERGEEPGIYIAGGADGARHVLDGANEIGRSSMSTHRVPAHERTRILTAEAANYNILLNNHDGCAARIGAQAVGATVRSLSLRELQAGSELLLGQSLPVSTLRKAHEYVGNPDNYSPLSPDEAYEYMNKSGVPNHGVRQSPHVAKQLIVEHRPGAYNIADAWDQETPGYGFSPSGMVQIADVLNDSLPTATPETVLAVASVWQYGVMMHLPHGGDASRTGTQLDYMPFDVVHAH